jgi:tetratricopeptide (TPR) repeat protein
MSAHDNRFSLRRRTRSFGADILDERKTLCRVHAFQNEISPPLANQMSRKSKKKASLAKAAVAPARPTRLDERRTVLGVCIFLAAIVWAVFGQTLHHEFVSFDDGPYVYDNPIVQKGLTWEGFRWALTYSEIGHWHPLTWLSHMLDCQLFGVNAGEHHLTNVLLHMATVILLFLVLRQMTGALWRSAFVSAVFAIHPLRVESVAWVAERKDVLSGMFFMLTLGAYVSYVRHPRSAVRYGAVLLFFALGLLSKNMLVTLPFVLLLLDYWPLKRVSDFSPRVLLRLVAEKIPLFMLTVATALVSEKVAAGNRLSFALRLENAVTSYVTYLWQMIDPTGLACLYPNPVNDLPLWQVAGALVLLVAMSVAAFAFRKTQPSLLVGWLWYLGVMIPVIGIVQISYYSHADRYTYLPQIGIYLFLTWSAVDLLRDHRAVLVGVATIILAALIFFARTQTAYWQNSESLWAHALACTSGNYIAHNSLGNALFQKGRVDEAIVQFQKVLQIKPDFADAHLNLGNALLQKGGMDEAIVHYQQVLQIKPDDALAHSNLGAALYQKGNLDGAIAQYQQALQSDSNSTLARINLDNALLQKGTLADAITQIQKSPQINPETLEVQNDPAWTLATAPQASLRNGNQAVELAQQVNQLTGGTNLIFLRSLAAAFAETGRFADAQQSAQKAIDLARASEQTNLVNQISGELKLYAASFPFHQETK